MMARRGEGGVIVRKDTEQYSRSVAARSFHLHVTRGLLQEVQRL